MKMPKVYILHIYVCLYIVRSPRYHFKWPNLASVLTQRTSHVALRDTHVTHGARARGSQWQRTCSVNTGNIFGFMFAAISTTSFIRNRRADEILQNPISTFRASRASRCRRRHYERTHSHKQPHTIAQNLRFVHLACELCAYVNVCVCVHDYLCHQSSNTFIRVLCVYHR